VINKQRETIYEERDKVLKNEDLADTVLSFIEREIDAIVDRNLPGSMSAQEWDFEALSAALESMGLASEETKPDALEEFGSREAVAINLKDIAAEHLDAKQKELGDDWAILERLVLLRTIDSIWVEHLTEVDSMRQGIGLRGFAQEDPLNAFKKEAFGLFEEMSGFIRHQVATTIFRVSLIRQTAPPPAGVEGRGQEEPVEPASGDGGSTTLAAAAAAIAAAGGRGGSVGGRALPKPLPQGRAVGGSQSSGSSSSGGGSTSSGAIRPGYSPAGIRMGRNDQCWCGSGKKYKKCHGL